MDFWKSPPGYLVGRCFQRILSFALNGSRRFRVAALLPPSHWPGRPSGWKGDLVTKVALRVIQRLNAFHSSWHRSNGIGNHGRTCTPDVVFRKTSRFPFWQLCVPGGSPRRKGLKGFELDDGKVLPSADAKSLYEMNPGMRRPVHTFVGPFFSVL